MKIMAVIPAYNEENSIRSVVEDIRTNLPQAVICVVNDGSTDRTGAIIDALPDVKVLHLPFNMGIGGAVWTGFHFFLESDCDVVLRLDGDGQHPPSQARLLLEELEKEQADLVIGSRFLKKAGFQSSLTRRGGIKLLHILSRFILRLKITDNTSGFRAFSRRAAALLVEDYPFDYPEPIEVYLLARAGLRIREVPTTMNSRQGGVSSIGLFQSYYYLVKVLLTIFVNFLYGGKHESLSD
jgi:glycosyltransferase involved in cell wall biosynthesis